MSEKLSVFLEKAQRYCSSAEQCIYTVKKKMHEWGVDDDEKDYIIGELIADGFINEGRYAEAFARGKFRMLGWGRNKIRYHLKANQVSEQNIRLALEAIDDEEYIQKLQNLVQRKWDSLKETNILQKKQKTVVYLVQKGFETDMILDEIKQRYNK